MDEEKDADGVPLYRLDYPNREVRRGLNRGLLDALTPNWRSAGNGIALRRALAAADWSGLEALFRKLLAGIPHDWHRRNEVARYEGYWSSVFYAWFQASVDGVAVEDATSRGRLDLAVVTGGAASVLTAGGPDAQPRRARSSRLIFRFRPGFDVCLDEHFQYGQFAIGRRHFASEFHELIFDVIDVFCNTLMGIVAIRSGTFDLPVERRSDTFDLPVERRSDTFDLPVERRSDTFDLPVERRSDTFDPGVQSPQDPTQRQQDCDSESDDGDCSFFHRFFASFPVPYPTVPARPPPEQRQV